MSEHSHAAHDLAASEPIDRHATSATPVSRRQWIGIAGGAVVTVASVMAFRRFGTSGRGAIVNTTAVTLYAEKDCACCHKWAAHMERNGFTVTTQIVADVGVTKDKLGVPADLRSCHTAEVAGYIIEGHVPAGDIKRFLAERSAERGLAVPDMPGGSPGMESDPKVPYDVLAFDAGGRTRVFARG